MRVLLIPVLLAALIFAPAVGDLIAEAPHWIMQVVALLFPILAAFFLGRLMIAPFFIRVAALFLGTLVVPRMLTLADLMFAEITGRGIIASAIYVWLIFLCVFIESWARWLRKIERSLSQRGDTS